MKNILLCFVFFFSLISASLANENNIKYSSKGNPNAQGLNIKLEYPNNWHIENINREDNTNNQYKIIDMFVANSDEQVACMLSVIKLPKAYSYDEWKKIINDKELMNNEFTRLLFHNENEYGIKSLPSKDIVLIQDEINGFPTVIANYTGNLKYDTQTAYQEGLYYILNYKNISINFNCHALTNDENQTKVLMDKYYPIVSSIASSINLDTKIDDITPKTKQRFNIYLLFFLLLPILIRSKYKNGFSKRNALLIIFAFICCIKLIDFFVYPDEKAGNLGGILFLLSLFGYALLVGKNHKD